MPEIYRPARSGGLPHIDVRAYLLLPLALPLVPAMVLSMMRGRADHLLAEIATLGLIGAAVWLMRRGLRPQLQAEAPASASRLRWFGSGALALACAVCDRFLIGHGTGFTLLVAALTMLGAWLAWWPVARGGNARRAPDAPKAVREQLAQARSQIERLEALSGRIDHPQLTGRLASIAGEAREVLHLLEADPGDVGKARRFLSVYLEGALQVCERYERTALQHGVTTLEHSFTEVLDTIAQAFAEQRQRLLAHEVLDLDVQIEVLKRRLELEGIA